RESTGGHTTRTARTALAAHALKATHHALHTAFTSHLAHHFAHHFLLLKQTVKVLHFKASTCCYAAFARPSNQFWFTALLCCHGINQGFHMLKLFNRNGILRHLGQTAHARKFIEQG